MALSASTVWEVRSTGSDSNGGGFVAGASGTDFSQQASAQYTFTDLATTTGTSASPSVTSASHSFVATDVGNIMQITAGTSWTTGFYQIVSVSGGAATLDKACGSAGTLSAGTYAVGGALLSPGKAGSGFVAGNIIWVKSATYSITSATANVANGCVTMAAQSASANEGKLLGYTTARGDLGRPTLQASGISTFTLVTVGIGNSCENFIFDGASLTSSRALTGSSGRVLNCLVKNCTNSGISGGDAITCEATACSGVATAGISATFAFRCVSHDNITSCSGFGAATAIDCLAYNNAGAGFTDNVAVAHWFNCTAANNTGDGFKVAAGTGNAASTFHNLLSYGNTGWGINSSTNVATYAFNVFLGSNTAGAVTGSINITGQTNLTATPFTNSAGLDFSLNTTAGGGASVRAAGLPGAFPGTSTTGFIDGGAVQHADPVGGGGLLTHPGMTGGLRG